MVIHETEAVAVIHAGLSLPATAVVNGDVVVGARGDVYQKAVLAFRVDGVIDESGEDGVVGDMYIVETVAVVKFAGANLIALGDILLGDVDKDSSGVAVRSCAATRFGSDGQGSREDASFVVDMGHGVSSLPDKRSLWHSQSRRHGR